MDRHLALAAASVVCLALSALAAAGCRKPGEAPTQSQTSNTCCFSQNGTGNAVFTMPDSVATVRVAGTYTGATSKFVIWIGPQGSTCDVVFQTGCRLLVNELLGSFYGTTTYSATLQTGGGGLVQVRESAGVAWTITQLQQ